MMCRFVYVLAGISLFASTGFTQIRAAETIQPIVLSSGPRIDNAFINDQGDVAVEVTFPARIVAPEADAPVTAPLTVTNVTTPYGIHVFHSDGTLAYVAERNSSLPSLPPDTTISPLGDYILLDDGGLISQAQLAGGEVTSANNWAIVTYSPQGVVEIAARTGMALPADSPTSTLSQFYITPYFPLAADSQGQLTFAAYLYDPSGSPTSYWALFQQDATGTFQKLTPIVEVETTISTGGSRDDPGSTETVTVAANFSNPRRMYSNANGKILLQGTLAYTSNSGERNYTSEGLIVGDSQDGFRSLWTMSDVLPEIGYQVRTLRTLQINDSGQVAFSADYYDATTEVSYDSCIMLHDGTDWSPIVRSGEGTTIAADVSIYSIRDGLQMNNRGDIAYMATLAGEGIDSTNNLALFLYDAEHGSQLIAQQGVTMDDQGSIIERLANVDFLLNDRGQIALFNPYNSTNGIWATDSTGLLRSIVRPGEVLNVSDDPTSPDLRQVSSAWLSTDQSHGAGTVNGFNNRGQVAFMTYFADRSRGVFISNLVAVPEPTGLHLIVAGLLVVSGLRLRSWRG